MSLIEASKTAGKASLMTAQAAEEVIRRAAETAKRAREESQPNQLPVSEKLLPANTLKISTSVRRCDAQWQLQQRREQIQNPNYYSEVDAFRSWRDSGIYPLHKQFAENYCPGTGTEWDRTFREAWNRHKSLPLIVLIGPRGTGKSQMAACLLRLLALEGKWVKACPVADFFRELRTTFGDGSGMNECEFVNKWKHYDGIALDEIQERGESEWENRTLTNLIDARYGAMRMTILIANFSPDAFGEHVGSSILSRVQEIGRVIECTWPSFRLEKSD